MNLGIFGVFGTVVLPVLIIVALAYGFGKWKRIQPATISQVTFYLFSPALSFSGLTGGTLQADEALQIWAYVLILATLTTTVGLLTARLLRLDASTTSTFLLSTVFMNAGNLGISIALFAYGQPGFQRAVAYFVVHSILTGTLAVFIASRGHSSSLQAFRTMFKTPNTYAGLLGVLVLIFHIPVPETIQRVTSVMGQAAVPGMLTVLGLQLAAVKLGEDLPHVIVASVLRLGVGMVLAIGLAMVMGMTGVTRDVMILQASMPTAVFTVILAAEFKGKPHLATGVVLLTTLASIVTLTVLVYVLSLVG